MRFSPISSEKVRFSPINNQQCNIVTSEIPSSLIFPKAARNVACAKLGQVDQNDNEDSDSEVCEIFNQPFGVINISGAGR